MNGDEIIDVVATAFQSVLVATGDVPESRAACDELSEIAHRQGSEALAALAAQAEGAVSEGFGHLAKADARAWKAGGDFGDDGEGEEERDGPDAHNYTVWTG